MLPELTLKPQAGGRSSFMVLNPLLLMRNRLGAAKQLIRGRGLSNALNSWQELLPFGRQGLLPRSAGPLCPS